MGNGDTAIYEVDWEHQIVRFLHAGVWDRYLKLHHAYSYDEMEQLFLRHIYKKDVMETRNSLLHSRDGSLSYQVGERIQSREFQGLIPETGCFEWFSDFLVMGDAGKLIGNIRNIHGQKLKELENEYRAKHDQLTGLYNRKTFEELFEVLVQEHGTGCLGILDIDDFKKLNDVRGHIQGDQALEAVSRIMKECLPEGSLCGRFGGDEFLIFFPAVTEREAVNEAAERMMEQLSSLNSNGMPLAVSIGFAFCPEWGRDFVGLLDHADMALRFSKKAGKNRYTFCTAAIEQIINADEEESISGRQKRINAKTFDRRGPGKNVLAAILLSITVLVGAFYIGTSYGKSFRKVMMNESYTYLDEISNQLSRDVDTMMETNQMKMEVLCTMMQREPWEDAANLQKWLVEMEKIQGFSRIYLVDQNGVWYAQGERSKQMEMQDFTMDVVMHKKVRISPVQRINGKDCMALGYPVDIRTGDGLAFAGVVAALDGEKIQNQLMLTAFDGAGRSHIIMSDGRPVLQSDGVEQTFLGYNLFATLERAELFDQASVNQIREQIGRGERIQIHYRLYDEEKIAALVPVGVEDWYLMTVLSTGFVYEKSNAFSKLTMIACLVVGMVFLVLILIVWTVKERSRKRLIKAAYVDPITGGNNLNRFTMQVPYNMAISGYKSVILYANVVGFKTFNDRMGRTGADEILKKVYQVIDGSLVRGECMGRLMADHFGILLKAENLREVLGRIGNWNLQLMQISRREKEPYVLELDYGIYFIDEPGLDVPQMLDRANLARQSLAENHRGKVAYAVYGKELKDRLIYEKELTDRMETALEQGEFKMFLQAKYGLREENIVGAEALVRWQHPIRGMIMPGDFIPLFEKNGFIERLDLYMFREACKWIQQSIDRGIKPIPVSVNLSISHFYTADFLEEFRDVWAQFGFDPSLLELEFTESMMYGKIEEFQKIMEQIHHIGFRCSMDDFGSGYSSLNELGCLPFNVIKLDRQFFIDYSENQQKLTTVRYAIELIKALHMDVVAEGVESMEQVEWLKAYGCDIVQGYVFARPVEAEMLLEQICGSSR